MNTATAFSDRSIRLSVLAIIIGFGGFVIWGTFAKLDEGVTASGQIVVQDNRKEIQHLEGGMISAVHVKEGQMVKEGDVLMELAPLQSESARDELAQEFAVSSANMIRLTALRSEEKTVDFSPLDDIPIDDITRVDIVERQLSLFNQQWDSINAELSVLQSRRSALRTRRNDLAGEIDATERALTTAREDLALRRELLEEKLETIGNVSRLEREVSNLEAQFSGLQGERNQAIKNYEEVTNQIREAKARFQERVGRELLEAQATSLASRERLLAMDDRLARTVLRAPQSGTVLNLAATTIGGVVSPGQTVMEIVPDTDDLIVIVRLSPTDRDAVQPGQDVEAQFTAYKSFQVQRLDGKVLGVSADLIQDEVSGAFFYETRVQLDASSLDPNGRIQIIPGMPVDTFIASGSKRSFFDYVFEPIRSTMQRGTRMS
jgi:HlyD family type I secretion membrane fusion protein